VSHELIADSSWFGDTLKLPAAFRCTVTTCHCFENRPFSSFVVLMAISMADSHGGGNPVLETGVKPQVPSFVKEGLQGVADADPKSLCTQMPPLPSMGEVRRG
jgi:hypothetical protein